MTSNIGYREVLLSFKNINKFFINILFFLSENNFAYELLVFVTLDTFKPNTACKFEFFAFAAV